MLTVCINEGIDCNVESIGLGFNGFEGRCNILRSSNSVWDDIKAEDPSCGVSLIIFPHGGGVPRIKHDRQSAKSGNDLTQKLQPFASNIGLLDG